MHWHRSRQSFTNPRTFVHVIFELVYYRGTYRSVSTEDDSDDTICYRMPIHVKCHHYRSGSITNLPIQCQSFTNKLPILANPDPNRSDNAGRAEETSTIRMILVSARDGYPTLSRISAIHQSSVDSMSILYQYRLTIDWHIGRLTMIGVGLTDC